jgi:Sap, sulfolipid-1-addressing protein
MSSDAEISTGDADTQADILAALTTDGGYEAVSDAGMTWPHDGVASQPYRKPWRTHPLQATKRGQPVAQVIARAVLYGLIAAASPLAFAATVVVLRSHRARLNGMIFAAAFLLAGLVVVVAVVAIGSVSAPGPGGSSSVAAALELVLGLLLLTVGLRIRRGSAPAATDGAGRTQALLDRLALITPKTAFPAGSLLGIGGPKRLTIGIVAATTISGADLTTSQSVIAATVYVVIATLLVWVPVAGYLLAGRRTQAWLTEAEAWLLANQRLFAVVSLLVFGAVLAVDGLAQLL